MDHAGYFKTGDYIDYLLKNFDVEDAPLTALDSFCTRPQVDIIFSYIERLGILHSDHLLEVGCGLGRVLKVVKTRYGCAVSGIDVAEKTIELARERLAGLYTDLAAAPVEEMGFPAQSFSHILCWGVFDLTDQGVALAHMLDALKVGGKLLLTGKNDLFREDDTEALVAEVKSREKGIPNHYTDFDRLKDAVAANGGRIAFQEFFTARGDFSKRNQVPHQPERFYEYCLIIEKVRHTGPVALEIAAEFSKSWRLINVR